MSGLDLGGIFKGVLGGAVAHLNPQDVLKELITKASGPLVRPVIQNWAQGLSSESRRSFSAKFRKLGDALHTDVPSLADLQQQRANLDTRIAAYQAGGSPAPKSVDESSEAAASVGADIVDDIKL